MSGGKYGPGRPKSNPKGAGMFRSATDPDTAPTAESRPQLACSEGKFLGSDAPAQHVKTPSRSSSVVRGGHGQQRYTDGAMRWLKLRVPDQEIDLCHSQNT